MPVSTKPSFWWRHAVIYQIYPRSFADANGDGIGDLPGIATHLPYLVKLGVDAIWLSPCFRSPQIDAGYDVSDYRDIDPIFGTRADFEHLISEAHGAGLRVIADLVPNHTSDQHPWFQQALLSPPGSPERARYIFRDGKGKHGELPPNNWKSVFGGIAWTKEPERAGSASRQWYLHLFDSRQPDLNWDNPEVRAEFEDILRFWLDRGVDGFRIDVAHGLIKGKGLPDFQVRATMVGDHDDKTPSDAPMWDREGIHDIYRSWRSILNTYPDERMLVAEAWVKPQERLARYVRSDEMHQAFNFDYLLTLWNAQAYRDVIDTSIQAMNAVGAPATWVMSNHDTVRHVTCLGLSIPGTRPPGIGENDEQPDEELGLRRARAAIFMTLGLPGSVTLYQGEELGLPEHTTMEARFRQDPAFFRTEGKEIGRDGCRIPFPWKADAPALGFNTTGKTWLPQPKSYKRYAVDQEEKNSDSTLALYRQLLKIRKERGLGDGALQWHESVENVLDFENGSVRVVINFGTEEVPLPQGTIMASSLDLDQTKILPGNSAVWLENVD
ncbi:glycoside hydrolase family 13 protein [Kozakia baliensis]|uniref:glycoside hydrolase family 13 protein n=1 Tax=Kozakia baliensis TaxID=153496 RepID=UPI00345B9CCE